MYRQAYPWQAARQQPADGLLAAEGEGLAFMCFSCDIAGATSPSFPLLLTSETEIEGAIDRMCGAGQVRTRVPRLHLRHDLL
jgi:hypothetical protein